jgi:recombination protein RecA
MYGEGTSREGEILDLGSDNKVVEKSGSWYSYNGERIGQGKDNARMYLKERPVLAREIENKVRAALGVRELPPALADDGSKPKLKAVGADE